MTTENKNENEVLTRGAEFGLGLRETSRYTDTQLAMATHGLTELVLNQTPPVGLNLQILIEQMPAALAHLEAVPDNPAVALFGLAIVDGVSDTFNLLQHLGSKGHGTLHVVDIDQAIIEQVAALGQENVSTFHEDARHTSLLEHSQDIIIRDHLGNCCPPEMYTQIEHEVARVLATSGLSLVNITTSENLLQSPGRRHMSFEQVCARLPEEVRGALQSRIFSLAQLADEFPDNDWSDLRGCIVEIAPQSFVVFGEDEHGHGEWFSAFACQEKLWNEAGFEVLAHHTREGEDSHQPPLLCVRHIVLLKKKQEGK
jgi:hypothetical protein